MSLTRWLALVCGPAAIIAGCYWLTFGLPDFAAADAAPAGPRGTVGPLSTEQQSALQAACERTAEELREQMGPQAAIVVRPPYVLSGDLSAERLQKLHAEVLVPVGRALHTSYFDRRPTEPIAVVALSDEGQFAGYVERDGGPLRNCYSGFYLRERRRIVVNAGSGTGTLAHELTHALAHVDCPQLPEWFDEGLAALHEECVFTKDRLRLQGRPNWRFEALQAALKGGPPPSIEALMRSGRVRGGDEAVAYALARSFCLYLQERGLLGDYYRKLKLTVDRDPSGVLALKDLLHADSLGPFESDFRGWLRSRSAR